VNLTTWFYASLTARLLHNGYPYYGYQLFNLCVNLVSMSLMIGHRSAIFPIKARTAEAPKSNVYSPHIISYFQNATSQLSIELCHLKHSFSFKPISKHGWDLYTLYSGTLFTHHTISGTYFISLHIGGSIEQDHPARANDSNHRDVYGRTDPQYTEMSQFSILWVRIHLNDSTPEQ
jgi:hypothetical protein